MKAKDTSNIYERDSKKKGKYLQVKFKIKDPDTPSSYINREEGRFYLCDFPAPADAWKAAMKCRNKAREEIEMGAIAASDVRSYTVADCYERTKELLPRSLKTKRSHDSIYRQLVPKRVAAKKITAVIPADVQATLNEYAKTHSASCVADAWTIWTQIYQVAGLLGLPVINMMQRVQKPKSKVPIKRRPNNCTTDDINKLLDGLAKYGMGHTLTRHRCECLDYAFRIMLFEGLRPQEVFALSREDIDLETMTLYIRKSVGSNEDEPRQIITTKTEQSESAIPIAEALKPTLEELLEWSANSPLLADLDGKPMEIDTLSALLINVRKRFNLPRVTMYMPRHLTATALYKSAENPQVVRKLLRHASLGTTVGYLLSDDADEMRGLINAREF